MCFSKSASIAKNISIARHVAAPIHQHLRLKSGAIGLTRPSIGHALRLSPAATGGGGNGRAVAAFLPPMKNTPPILFAVALLAGCVSTPHSNEPAAVHVTFDRDGIVREQAWGIADRATGRAVTAGDPVRIASISKLVVAIGVMRLVETGTLDLDADISGPLGIRVRNPAFPEVPITLRLLLSHRSSMWDRDGYLLPLGTTLAEKLTDEAVWDREHAPGSYFRYTNLNFPVIATVMERATGERFDKLMKRMVFAPLKIDACFNWATCSDEQAARAVVLYGADGKVRHDDLRGRRPACPVFVTEASKACDLSVAQPGANGGLFSPQGGLRISMRDLARIGRLLAGGGEVDGVRLLAPASIDALVGPEWQFDGSNGDTGEMGEFGEGFFCRYGLATQTLAAQRPNCRDDMFGDGVQRFGHSGSAYGLRSGLFIDRATGTGAAFFATAVPEDAVGRSSSFTAHQEALARGRRPGR